MASLADDIFDEILDTLDKEGERILQECVDERDYTHRTMNLHDSYGYGVYLKGTLKRYGFLTSAPKATQSNHEWYGRDEIESFLFKTYQPTGGIDMVVVAAMPYATNLEYGIGIRKKYRVITMSYQKLKALASKIGCGTVQQVISGTRV